MTKLFDLTNTVPNDGAQHVILPRRRALAVGAALAMGGFFGSTKAQAAVQAQGLRLGQRSGTVTRFVLELDQSVTPRAFLLDDPYRVVVDLPDMNWDVPEASLPDPKGVVKAMRFGQFRPGVSRIVLDLTEPAVVQSTFVLPPSSGFPFRLVIDLEQADRAAFLAALQATKSARPAMEALQDVVSPPVTTPTRETKPGRKPVIVLDPGHGGVDPGATGVSGVYEKNITLAMARELKKKLERTGRYKVMLTRDRDIFLRLRERVNLARRAHGDLFMSLHADSIGRKDVRGLSVYTLSEKASDSEAAALAEAENKADIIAGVDLTHESKEVTDILIDLAQRESMNFSSDFADMIVDELGRQVTLLRNTHRFAGFAVLKAPDIPSVLIELGYLSNRQDERLLRQPQYRAKLASAVTNATDRYFAQVQQAAMP